MKSIVIHTDKWLHALASAPIVTAAFLVLAGAGVPGVWAAVLSVVIAAAAGVGILVGLVPVILFLIL